MVRMQANGLYIEAFLALQDLSVVKQSFMSHALSILRGPFRLPDVCWA